MKLLIIGASSYVVARLYFDLQKTFVVVGTYSSSKLSDKFTQLDVTNKENVNLVLEEIKPDVIIDTANNASANWCDANPEKAIALNQKSTEYIVEAANRISAKVIYISSMAAIEPQNLYGRTKLESERITKLTKAGYLILRPSLILGYSPNTTNDRPFNRLLNNLDKGVPAIYDISWKFQPTYIGQISEVIKKCVESGYWNYTITIAASDLKSRFDTAKDILSPFGIKVTPVDNHDDTFATFQEDDLQLKLLNLPAISYKNMITKIIQEIKQRDDFVI